MGLDMSENPLDRIPAFNRISIRAVRVHESEDPSAAHLLSSSAKPGEPHGLDSTNARFTTTGFDLGRSGMFDEPTAP